MMNNHKVLVIKLGYSETLNGEMGFIPSPGDVLRTTVILHRFKDYHVSWLVDEKAASLLKNNPYVHRILIFNSITTLQLQAERFDTVINFEKVPGICALSDSIQAWRRFGFRFDPNEGKAQAYDGTEQVLNMSADMELKKTAGKYWQEALFEMLGGTWDGEEYILGYQPKSTEIYDLGFNHHVGSKWPNKAWPESYWKEL